MTDNIRLPSFSPQEKQELANALRRWLEQLKDIGNIATPRGVRLTVILTPPIHGE